MSDEDGERREEEGNGEGEKWQREVVGVEEKHQQAVERRAWLTSPYPMEKVADGRRYILCDVSMFSPSCKYIHTCMMLAHRRTQSHCSSFMSGWSSIK